MKYIVDDIQMAPQASFETDAQGFLRFKIGPGMGTLSAFFETSVQGWMYSIDLLENMVQESLAGKELTIERFSGNMHDMTIEGNFVHIENNIEPDRDDQFDVTPEVFLKLLSIWKERVLLSDKLRDLGAE